MIETNLRITVNHPVKCVRGLVQVPEKAKAIMVLAHGAGAGMQHPHMESLASGLLRQSIACFRYQFPFMEQSTRRPDTLPVAINCTLAAIETAIRQHPNLPLFIGGHSFGGRIATHAAIDLDKPVSGLIGYSFPLHPAKKPSVKRAAHLNSIQLPMLFINGDRDRLAETELLEASRESLPNLNLHWLPGADHSYKTTKRSGRSQEQTYLEAASISRAFIDMHSSPTKT